MEKFKEKIKKYLNQHKNFNDKVIDPSRHWTILLSIFFVFVLCLIAFSVYLLIEIRNDTFLQAEPVKETNQVSINKELIDKVTKYFDDKAQKTAEIKASAEVIHDPSL
jgi:hypothetical protein